MDELLPAILVGALAQLVEGLVGYGYGATGSALLLASGVPPVTAALSLHGAGMTQQSLLAALHWRLGNVRLRGSVHVLLLALLGAGVGLTCALLLPDALWQVLVGVALIALGGWWLSLAWRQCREQRVARGWRAVVAGLLAAGSPAGWSTLVSAPLRAEGFSHREVEGNSSVLRWAVTVLVMVVLLISTGTLPWLSMLGLLVGAVLAAPFASQLAGRLPAAQAASLLGLLVVLASGYGLLRMV